jgi:hypothetical protein
MVRLPLLLAVSGHRHAVAARASKRHHGGGNDIRSALIVMHLCRGFLNYMIPDSVVSTPATPALFSLHDVPMTQGIRCHGRFVEQEPSSG